MAGELAFGTVGLTCGENLLELVPVWANNFSFKETSQYAE